MFILYKVWNTRGKLYAVNIAYIICRYFTKLNKNDFEFNTIIKNVRLSVNNGNYNLIYWTLYEYKWSLINIYNAEDTIYKTTIRMHIPTIHKDYNYSKRLFLNYYDFIIMTGQ